MPLCAKHVTIFDVVVVCVSVHVHVCLYLCV